MQAVQQISFLEEVMPKAKKNNIISKNNFLADVMLTIFLHYLNA